MKFRFTQNENHGQEVVVESDNEQDARNRILAGEGDSVGEPWYIRTTADPLQLMESGE